MLIYAAILIISVCFIKPASAQNTPDTVNQFSHSPKKATYLALVPGLGQIYNKKYWKLPIVYAGFAVTGYLGFWYRGEYLKYNEAYLCKVNDPDCDNEIAIQYEADQILTASDYARRNMELSFIVMGAWYILQILDASVDAHLYYWEVNEDLSLRVEPEIQQLPFQEKMIIPGNSINHNGLKITVSF